METASKKQPDRTRKEILTAAYKEIFRYGFQGASLSRILNNVRQTKGALYHHFANKKELGLCVIDELVAEEVFQGFIDPLEKSDDPVATLIQVLQTRAQSMSAEQVQLGCPLSNIVREMGPIDELFRTRLQAISDRWVGAIRQALERGQQNGTVQKTIDTQGAALFIVAAIQGCLGLGQSMHAIEPFQQGIGQLQHYIQSLAA